MIYKPINRYMERKKGLPRGLKGQWYTILIIAGKKAKYRARPSWCQDGVNTDTNDKLC